MLLTDVQFEGGPPRFHAANAGDQIHPRDCFHEQRELHVHCDGRQACIH
jgi:hypothetical protein